MCDGLRLTAGNHRVRQERGGTKQRHCPLPHHQTLAVGGLLKTTNKKVENATCNNTCWRADATTATKGPGVPVRGYATPLWGKAMSALYVLPQWPFTCWAVAVQSCELSFLSGGHGSK